MLQSRWLSCAIFQNLVHVKAFCFLFIEHIAASLVWVEALYVQYFVYKKVTNERTSCYSATFFYKNFLFSMRAWDQRQEIVRTVDIKKMWRVCVYVCMNPSL